MIDIPYDDTILTWVTTFKKKCNFEIQVTTIIKKTIHKSHKQYFALLLNCNLP